MSQKHQMSRTTSQMFASFKLGGSELSLPITALQEVVNVPDKISAVPMAPPYLFGLFNLRGAVIPIVDVSKILNLPTDPLEKNKKIAIIHSKEVRIGLLFDSTSEILSVDESNISIFDLKEDNKKIILGALKLNGGDRIVEIIDPEALVKVENIPHVLEKTSNTLKEVHKKTKRQQCITFCSQESKFAFNISAISEIIRVPVVQSKASGPDYGLGVVNIRGMVIPLINFCQFLKVADEPSSDKEKQRIIIMKQDKIHFGFLVDSVDSIVSYYEEEILPIPLFKQQKMEIFKGLLSHDTNGDLLFLDDSKILTHDEIKQITHGWSSIYGQESGIEESKKKKAGVRVPFLSFKLEHLFSSNLREVDEIAVVPNDIMKPPGYPDFVTGVLKMRGDVITVINLRKFYGLKDFQDTASSRVLIVKGKNSKLGLLVDSVEAIENVDESNKLKIPTIVATSSNKELQAAIKEIVEMTDVSGQKKTFMIMDVTALVDKIETLFSAA